MLAVWFVLSLLIGINIHLTVTELKNEINSQDSATVLREY